MKPSPLRPSRASVLWLMALASLGAMAGLAGLLALDVPGWFATRSGAGKLVVFCAAGLKPPLAALARQYQRLSGVEVQIQYGGSNTLLSTLQIAPKADLFIPADDSYVALARRKKLIAEVVPLATMRPVLAVREDNPKSYTGLSDFMARKGRVSQASPEAAAVGKVTRDALVAAGLWESFKKRIVVTKPTVNDVAADIQVGAADGGFVWDVTVHNVPGLQIIPAPPLKGVKATLSACVVKSCTQPAAALRFARYLASVDVGGPVFQKEGYVPAGSDPWSETPTLRLRLGSMLRPAMEKTLTAFEAREGVKIVRSYNGCGILVAEMKAGDPTDAFMACDREFMTQVGDLFGPSSVLSSNQLVLLVKKGNPHGIHTLADLARPGLRVGIGHEKQCAMGVLTQRALKQDGSTSVVMKNVKVQSPTGDLLVNQMLTGSLDAAVAYITNAAGHADKLEAIRIDIPCAYADQPYAIGVGSSHKALAGRLLDFLRAAESKQRFKDVGFTWKGDASR